MCHLSFLIIFITFCSRCIYSLSSLIILFRNLLHLFISIQIQIPSWPSFISFLLFWRSLTRWQKIFLTFQCSFVSSFPHVLCFVFPINLLFDFHLRVVCLHLFTFAQTNQNKTQKTITNSTIQLSWNSWNTIWHPDQVFFFLQRCSLSLDH